MLILNFVLSFKKKNLNFASLVLWNSSCILSALSLATDVGFQQPYFCQKFLVYSPLFLAIGSLSTIFGFWQPCLFQKFSIFSVLSCTTALGIANPVSLNSFLVFQLCFLQQFLVRTVLVCATYLGFFSALFQAVDIFQFCQPCFLQNFLILPALFSVTYHCFCQQFYFCQLCSLQQFVALLVLALDLSALFLSTDLSFLISCNSSYFFKQVFVQIFLILSAGSLKTIPAFLASLLQQILSGFNSYKISCS